jgi:hypothetical protein
VFRRTLRWLPHFRQTERGELRCVPQRSVQYEVQYEGPIWR